MAVVYSARVDLLAVDAADEYWVVRHLIVDDWQDVDALLRDEEAVAACWAWEQDYIGMDIAGTIHNEVRIGGRLEMPAERESVRKQVAQHERSTDESMRPRQSPRATSGLSNERPDSCVAPGSGAAATRSHRLVRNWPSRHSR